MNKITKTLLSLSISLTAFFWMKPYFQWHSNTLFRVFLFNSLLLFLIYVIKPKIEIKRIDIFMFVFLSLMLIYYSLAGAEGQYGFSLGYLVMLIYILLPDDYKQRTFQFFSLIFAVSLVPGIIIMLLALIGFDFNPTIIQSETGRDYRQYLGAVALTFNFSDVTEFRRLHGMFDEPGVVGTFAALFLVGDKFKLKNSPKNIVIFIGGLLSLSFAFMVMFLIYLILRFNIKYIISGLLLAVILISLLPKDNYVLGRYIFDRFSIEDGQIAGNNRLTEFTAKQELSNFYGGDFGYLIFGMGNSAHQINENIRGSSWQFFVYDYGLFGISLLVAGILFYAVYKSKVNKYHGLLLITLFFLSFYQRPLIINLQYMVILVGGIVNLQYYFNKNDLPKN